MNKTEKFWDGVSKGFEKRANKFDPAEIRTLENTRKYLHDTDVVLDYGCGIGTMAIEISDRVKMIHGIDISQNMIAFAKSKAAEHDIGNIHFSRSTIFDCACRKDSFDVILAFNILHFIKDSRQVLSRIHDLLKPGGLIIAVTPCLRERKSFMNILIFSLVFSQVKMGMLPYTRFLKASEFKDSISDADFQIIESESLHGPGEPYYIVAKKN